MAAMALQLRSKYRPFQNPRLVHLFSSASDSNGDDDKKEPQSQPPPSISSYFSDVKASLRNPSPPPRVSPSPSPPPSSSSPLPSFSSSNPSKDASFDEIRKNLAEFRRRSAVPPQDHRPPPSTVSFQDLYKKNVNESNVEGPKKKLSFDSIRESLKQLRMTNENQNQNQPQNDRFRGQDNRSNRVDPYSLKHFRENLKSKPEGMNQSQSKVIGGSEVLPPSVFGKEMGPRSDAESQALRTEFVKNYTYEELGKKLVKLRPTDANKKGKSWFTLEELNERLRKLREEEEQAMDSNIGGVLFRDLRESLVKLRMSGDDKMRKSSMGFDFMAHMPGAQPEYKGPPKEHLVEKYFHPDNMSSEEKLKLELQKVRDEFKLSESDCGSSPVQIAQLTTKIKHLSSALHKKDKHSRKGLLAMVQNRNKLLKYLRRTDWDSYCLVISKLGLRDSLSAEGVLRARELDKERRRKKKPEEKERERARKRQLKRKKVTGNRSRSIGA